MATENVIGDVVIQVRADLSQYDKGVEQAKAKSDKFTEGTQKEMQGVTAATRGASAAAAALGGQFAQVTQRARTLFQSFEQTRNSASGLASATGEVNTQIGGFGVNVTTVAAIVGVTFVTAMLRASDAISDMHNELARTPAFANNAAQALQFVQSVAANSNRPLRELVASYAQLSEQARLAGISQQRVNELFREREIGLNAREQDTVGGSFGKLAEAVGNAAAGFDRVLGVSRLIADVTTRIASGFNYIASLLPGFASPLLEAQSALEGLKKRQTDIVNELNSGNVLIQRRQRLNNELNQNIREQARLIKVIYDAQRGLNDPTLVLRRQEILQDINRELDHEVSLLGMSRSEQEVRNRLLQAEMQMRELGMKLTESERAALEARLRGLAAAREAIDAMRDSLQETFTSLTDKVFITDWNVLLDTAGFANAHAELQRAYEASAMSFQRFQQMKVGLYRQEQQIALSTAEKVVGAVQALWPKQKGVAIAAAIANTALGVTRALAQTPFPYSFVEAAAVAAAGAAQVNAIRSANPGGGSLPSVRGQSTPIAAPTEQEPTPTRAISIRLESGAVFSGGQVQSLIEAISSEVKNGATLISTETLRA